jgi:hypothetical protein
MMAATKQAETREVSEAELSQINGGAVPSPAILYREQAEKTATDVWHFITYMSTQWPY